MSGSPRHLLSELMSSNRVHSALTALQESLKQPRWIGGVMLGVVRFPLQNVIICPHPGKLPYLLRKIQTLKTGYC